MSFVETLLAWTNATFLPLGTWGLFILSFIESSFFPIPPDLLLITFAIEMPEQALWFAAVATLGSVLGGMFGYAIGYFGGQPVLERFVSKKKIAKVHTFFNRYEAWAIFIAGFTPLPYKVFTIAGGVFSINFRKFILASLVSRGLRFFIEAVLIMYFGKTIVEFLTSTFNLITISVVMIFIVVYVVYVKRKSSSLAKVF